MMSRRNSSPFELVMVVDDNEMDNFVSRRVMELSGFCKNVIMFTSGREALQYLRENQYTGAKLPDVIFLDINMPIVDGFMFLYEYDELSDFVHDKCKVVVLSSVMVNKQVERILSNEYVNDYIAKPLTVHALMHMKLYTRHIDI